MKIYEYIKKSKNYDLIKNQIIMQNSRSALSGAIRSCAANLIYALMEDSEKKGIYFAANSLNAGKIAEDLRFFSDGEGEDILLLEPYEYMLYDVETKSTEQSAARVEILYRILRGDWKLLVMTPAAAAQWLPNPSYIRDAAITLKQGDVIEIQDLTRRLSEIRYNRVPQIDGKGQFSVRGDIVDIFPYTSENPVRIEFFDNEIDSVRIFDVLSQRKIQRKF